MRIIVSQGDINGIGLEAFIKAVTLLNFKKPYDDVEFALCTNSTALQSYFKAVGQEIEFATNSFFIGKREIGIIECDEEAELNLGQVRADSGKLAGKAIEVAIENFNSGLYAALLTLPISKEAIKLGGYNFPGHTEMIGDFYGVKSPLMILCSEVLRVALVTIHEPIAKVAELITQELIMARLEQFGNSLIYDYGISNPRIAVLGLNPHAGENGKIGSQEKEIIIPAIKKYPYAFGAFPADGFFAHSDYKNYDGVLAMYHDQGLIPLKMIAGGAGVNFTAGLPIISTSPDHGTAFAIAGRGIAEPESTLNAIELAVSINNNRNKVIC
jgi:4-hydroxythreonine-4-phosphate dehydrogenase